MSGLQPEGQSRQQGHRQLHLAEGVQRSCHDSTYLQDDGDWMRRTFRFVVTTEGVEGEEVNDAETKERMTSVKLTGLRAEYE